MDEQVNYEVGKKYDVMTLMTGRDYLAADHYTYKLADFMGMRGILPLLGDWATDEEFFPVKTKHVHIDLRFLTPAQFLLLSKGFEFRYQVPVLTFENEIIAAAMKPQKLRMVCRRSWPETDWGWNPELGQLQTLLERQGCIALRNGRCPHRGTPVAAMIEVGGKLVCPAHGLRWNKDGTAAPWDKERDCGDI